MIILKKYFKGDTAIWIITLLLLIISVPAVYSASAMISHKSYQGDMHFLIRQISAVILALIVVYVAYKIPYKTYLSLIKIIFPITWVLGILRIRKSPAAKRIKNSVHPQFCTNHSKTMVVFY